MEVTPGSIARIEGEADKCTIEPEAKKESPQTSKRLQRQILLRAGGRCENPRCRRELGLQCHHLRARSEGGETSLENEIAACPTCHGLLHGGALEVFRGASGSLHWQPRAEKLKVELEGKVLEALGGLAPRAAVQNLNREAPGRRSEVDALDAVKTLRMIGRRKEVAVRSVSEALKALEGAPGAYSLSDLVNEALKHAREIDPLPRRV